MNAGTVIGALEDRRREILGDRAVHDQGTPGNAAVDGPASHCGISAVDVGAAVACELAETRRGGGDRTARDEEERGMVLRRPAQETAGITAVEYVHVNGCCERRPVSGNI